MSTSCSAPGDCSCVTFIAAINEGERSHNYDGSFTQMYTSDSYEIDKECFSWYKDLQQQNITVPEIRKMYGGCTSWPKFEKEIVLYLKSVKKSIQGNPDYTEELIKLDSMINAWE